MPRDSRSRRFLPFALAAATLAIAFASMESRGGMGLTFESGEYADIAREIARGNGFRSHVLYPSVMASVDAAGASAGPGGTYPVMNRHPGFPFVLAPFVAAFGDSDRAVRLGFAACFALWVWVAFRVVERRLGRAPALATATLLALNPAFVAFLVPGGFADILFAALALVFLDRCADPQAAVATTPWRWFLVGLAGAAAWTVRFNFSLLAYLGAASLLLPRPDRRRVASAVALLLGFWFGCAPFQAWHAWTFGTGQSPPTLWNLLDGFPGYESPWKQYRVLGLADVIDTGLWRDLLARKFPYLLFLSLKGLPTILLYLVPFPFFVAALFRRDRAPSDARFLGLATAGFAAMLLVMAFFRFETWSAPGGREIGYRYFVWFMPVLVAYAADEALRRVADRGTAARIGVPAVLMAVQLAWFGAHAGPLGHLYRTAGDFDGRPSVRALARLDADGAIPRDLPIATNVPAQVGWYLDRPALLLPGRPDEVGPLWQRHPVAGLLFTRLDIGEPARYGAWASSFADADATRDFLRRARMRIAFADDEDLLLVATGPGAAAAGSAPASSTPLPPAATVPPDAAPPATAPATE